MRNRNRLKLYYRALVILAMRDAGHTLSEIAGYFWISAERVRQIVRRGPVPAQLTIPLQSEETAP